MDIDLLKKRLKEIQESIAAGVMPAVPGMENINQSASPNPVNTYNPPEVNVPNVQPKTTPISTNTQTPKTTQPTSPISTPKDSTAKNTAIPSSAKNSSQAPADPKLGEAGAKKLKEIQKSDPMVYIKKNKFLAEAYNAGFYGTDITREARDNARAGGYLKQLEEMVNAGIKDSKGLGTELAQHENSMRELNIKQAQKLANTTGDTDDIYSDGLSIDALRREKFLQKKLDNLGKAIYTSGNTTGNGEDGNLGDFHDPTKTFPNTTQEYGVWYKPKKGYHMGIDIGNAQNTNLDIAPAYAGEVVFSGDTHGDNGIMVVIKHSINIDGTDVVFYTSYSHLASVNKSVGDKVKANDDPDDLIGIMGKTGTDDVHLHFAIFTREGEITDSFSAWGYGLEQINDFAWKKSSKSNAIYYDPLEVFRTNGAIILYTLNFMEEEKKKNAENN